MSVIFASEGLPARLAALLLPLLLWYTPDRAGPTCDGYDDYPFGLVDRNDYMRQTDADELRRRAITRDIFWTVGELDTEANGGCRANAQGEHRRARWANHRQHIAELCADLVAAGDLDVPVDCQAHDARHVEIAGCGHGHACSWDTAVGQAILFAP